MNTTLYWFRNDLRLHDNPALLQACAQADALLPVFCLDSASAAHRGDPRWGAMPASLHRQRVLLDTLIDLDAQLRALGSGLTVVSGTPADVLPQLGAALGAWAVHCEMIAAPYEQSEVDQLRQSGMEVSSRWQSSLHAPEALPFALAELPPVYSRFRQLLAKAGTRPAAPLQPPAQLPPLPQATHGCATVNLTQRLQHLGSPKPEPRASLPYLDSAFAGGERAALAHLRYGSADHDSVALSPENRVRYFTEAPPVLLGHTPLQLAVTVLLPAAVAALVYSLMAVATARDDLGGWPPDDERQARPPVPVAVPS